MSCYEVIFESEFTLENIIREAFSIKRLGLKGYPQEIKLLQNTPANEKVN